MLTTGAVGGVLAIVMLASTHRDALRVVPFKVLADHAAEKKGGKG